MKKRWKLLLILLAIGSGAYLYLHIRKTKDFEPQIKDKLAQLVSSATNGLYRLDIEQIEIDITAAAVSARNIVLLPDSARLLQLEKSGEAGNDIYQVSLKKLDIAGLSPLALLDNKNIKLDKLVLDSPEISITRSVRNKVKKDSSHLYDKIALPGQSYSIGHLLLNNIKLTVINTGKNKTVSAFNNLSALFTDIQIDSSSKYDSTRFLFAKDAVVFIKGFNQITPKRKYQFSIDSVALRPQHGLLQFYDLRLKPGQPKQEFVQRLTYEEDMYDLRVTSGTIKNINWVSLLAKEGFKGDEMTLNGASLYIYHDKRLPSGPPKHNNFPHQQLMNAGFPLSVKTTNINELDIAYEELNPASGQTGIVEFKNVHATIENLTNVPEEIKVNPFAVAKASALFMNSGRLDALFTFDMPNAANGNFSVEATLGPMDGTKLNSITRGLALLNVKNLAVDKLKLHITGTNTRGRGNVLLAYHDLSFDVMKKDEAAGLKKRGLLSFVASTFVVKKSNPVKEGKAPEQVAVWHQHDPQRSFFNLIWKTLLQGILKTAK